MSQPQPAKRKPNKPPRPKAKNAAAPSTSKDKGGQGGDNPVPLNRKGLFTNDLARMMYGFGDSEKPLQETVDVVEEIVVDYMVSLLQKAMQRSALRDKLLLDDLVLLVRKNPRQFDRVIELLQNTQEINQHKSATEQKSQELTVDDTKEVTELTQFVDQDNAPNDAFQNQAALLQQNKKPRVTQK